MAQERDTTPKDGKIQEIGGTIKKTLGKMLGNEQMETEGRVKELKAQAGQEAHKSAERVKGAVEEAAGALKNQVGKLTGDELMQGEGKLETLKGQARQKASMDSKTPTT